MHIPDGFLDGKTLGVSAVIAAVGVSAAAYRVTKSLPRRKVPLLGLAGAFVFAAQMLNFPVAGGTSGHLIGGVLASVLLGPSAGILVLTCVLLVQCLMFADGGLLALGANVVNMAIVDSVGGWLIYSAVSRLLKPMMGAKTGGLAAVAFAAWCGTVLASLVCTGMLVASGAVAAKVGLPAMVGVHALIGLGEAALTTMVIAATWTARPDLITTSVVETEKRPLLAFAGFGLLVALALATFVSPLASSSPDGLEKIAEDKGFAERAAEPHKAPIPDYAMPKISSEALATGLAGLVGTAIVFGLSLALARALSRKDREPQGAA